MPARPRLGLMSAVLLSAVRAWSGTSGFAFLAAPPAAEPAGMAGAAAAQTGASWAAYYNPAGLAHLDAASVSLHGLSMWSDVRHEAVSHARPVRWGGWSATAGVMGVGGLVRTRYDAASPDRFVETGEVKAGSQYLQAAAGFHAGRELTWGLGATLVREELDADAAWTLLADAGLQGVVEYKYRWGLSLLGAGPGARGAASPARLQAGLAYEPEPWLGWEIDFLHPLAGGDALMVGGRFGWEERAFLRVGYRHRLKENEMGSLSGASAGLGGRWSSFHLDYAFQPFGDFGGTHLASLSWRWGGETRVRFRPGRRRTFVR